MPHAYEYRAPINTKRVEIPRIYKYRAPYKYLPESLALHTGEGVFEDGGRVV